MQITVSGHHVEVTSSLREYVESKLQRLERHFDHLTTVHVVLSVEKLRQKAEAWDEGHHAGHEEARAVHPTYPDPTPNPYRQTEGNRA